MKPKKIIRLLGFGLVLLGMGLMFNMSPSDGTAVQISLFGLFIIGATVVIE